MIVPESMGDAGLVLFDHAKAVHEIADTLRSERYIILSMVQPFAATVRRLRPLDPAFYVDDGSGLIMGMTNGDLAAYVDENAPSDARLVLLIVVPKTQWAALCPMLYGGRSLPEPTKRFDHIIPMLMPDDGLGVMTPLLVDAIDEVDPLMASYIRARVMRTVR